MVIVVEETFLDFPVVPMRLYLFREVVFVQLILLV